MDERRCAVCGATAMGHATRVADRQVQEHSFCEQHQPAAPRTGESQAINLHLAQLIDRSELERELDEALSVTVPPQTIPCSPEGLEFKAHLRLRFRIWKDEETQKLRAMAHPVGVEVKQHAHPGGK